MAGDDVDVKMIIEMKEDIASIKSILSTMANTNAMALEAVQSARSAHHRIDRIDKLINWVGTTVIGAVILAIVAFIVKGGMAN